MIEATEDYRNPASYLKKTEESGKDACPECRQMKGSLSRERKKGIPGRRKLLCVYIGVMKVYKEGHRCGLEETTLRSLASLL